MNDLFCPNYKNLGKGQFLNQSKGIRLWPTLIHLLSTFLSPFNPLLLCFPSSCQKQGLIQPSFLDAMTIACRGEGDAVVWTRLLRAVLGEMASLKQLGTSTIELEQQLRALDVFTSPPLMQRCLIAALSADLAAAASGAGTTIRGGPSGLAKTLEASSILGSLLGVRFRLMITSL